METSNFKLRIFIVFVMLVIAISMFANADLLNRKISIDAEDANISTVISNMAKLSNCNIVLATQVANEAGKTKKGEKKITIHLKNIPIEQALSLVVKSIGLSYRLIGDNTFLVGEKKQIEEEIGERTYVIPLNYVDVDKLTKALKILPGEATPIEGQNTVLLKANPETYAEIAKVIKEIDQPQKQVEIRARLIEVSITEAKKYGIDWSKLNRLTTILAEDPVNQNGVGLPFDYSDATGAMPHGNLNNQLGQLPQNQYFQKINGFSDIGHFSRQLTAFDITIDWLLQNNAAKILTDTRITALNGEEGYIHIGEVVPYVIQDKNTTTGQIQVQKEQVGIMLTVKPTINKDNQITTKIEPEVSSVQELVGGYIPRTKVRKITSTVTVKDGQRIVVGGLLSTNKVKHVSKVPFLGDLPYIGKLFRHLQTEMNKTDLIIEITPHIVTGNSLNKNYDIDPDLEKPLIKEKKE